MTPDISFDLNAKTFTLEWSRDDYRGMWVDARYLEANEVERASLDERLCKEIQSGVAGWLQGVSANERTGLLRARLPGNPSLGPPANAGVLSCMGYNVRSEGPNAIQRRDLLRDILLRALPARCASIGRSDGWGDPMSRLRYDKLMRALRTFVRNEQGRKRPSRRAISLWQADLEWLSKEFAEHPFT